MNKRCTEPECPAPKGLCWKHLSHEYPKCENWINNNVNDTGAAPLGERHKGQLPLPWQGVTMEPEDIPIISSRSNPLIIGMIGSADAGKTSYLSMLFRLLLNGWRFENWQFAGSYTLSAWENLAQYMVLHKDGKVNFPPPTPSTPDFYSLYHLALRQSPLFRDTLFADSSGEVFKFWAADTSDPAAENARWIYGNASAFILFVDCEALVNYRGRAVQDIRQMAEQLAAGLNGRPIMIVWSKADRIGDIKPNLRQILQDDLQRILGKVDVFEISNFSNPDDPSHYKNHLAVVSTLLHRVNAKSVYIPPATVSPQPSSQDFFFIYRGTYAVNK